MPRHRLLILLTIASVPGLLWSNWPSQAASVPFDKAIVRLYSDGEVVGQWEAVGPGRTEGSTFVFPIRRGVKDLEVRINGTFSFEVQP
jgi:hypothetical protein